MSWYKFWKKSGPMQIRTEDYLFLEEENYPTRENIKNECERWADAIPGGHNSHYSYGFRKVKTPPREILEKMLSDVKREENSLLEERTFLETELKKLKRRR
jgi:hypothetical protein